MCGRHCDGIQLNAAYRKRGFSQLLEDLGQSDGSVLVIVQPGATQLFVQIDETLPRQRVLWLDVRGRQVGPRSVIVSALFGQSQAEEDITEVSVSVRQT